MRLVREFGALLQISTGFAFWQLYCTASSSGRQPNLAALNRGRHLCSAGQPSRWALAHILVDNVLEMSRVMALYELIFGLLTVSEWAVCRQVSW